MTFIPRTASVGNMAFTGNLGGVATVIGVIGTFVRIGAGNPGTHPVFTANPNNKRFSMVGTTAPTQALLYTAEEDAFLCIRGAMSVQNPALTAQGFEVRLLKNGVAIPNTNLEGQTGGLVTSAGGLMVEGLVDVAQNDEFTIELANLTSTQNLVVSSAMVTVGAAS